MKSDDDDQREKCRTKLIEVARAKSTITYRELGRHLGLPTQSAGKYLDGIYKDEMSAGNPDLSLVVVYAGTEYGPYLSLGEPAKKIKMKRKNPEMCAKYKAELKKVYEHWGE
jgi:hypothetical protein